MPLRAAARRERDLAARIDDLEEALAVWFPQAQVLEVGKEDEILHVGLQLSHRIAYHHYKVAAGGVLNSSEAQTDPRLGKAIVEVFALLANHRLVFVFDLRQKREPPKVTKEPTRGKDKAPVAVDPRPCTLASCDLGRTLR